MNLELLTLDTPVEQINQAMSNTMMGHMKIRLERTAEGEIEASMPLFEGTWRQEGLMHGGANLVLAETIAGLGSMLLIDLKEADVRGINVTGSHVGAVRGGRVHAIAKIIHRGNQTHVWNVDIKNDDGRLVSTSRVTNMILRWNDKK